MCLRFLFNYAYLIRKKQIPLTYRTVVRKKKKEISTLFNIWTKNLREKLTKEGI